MAEAGGEGADLGELTRAGTSVPPGFVITTAAFDELVAARGLADRIVELTVEDTAAFEPTAEDLTDASFTGQQDTCLDVRGADAVLAVVMQRMVEIESSVVMFTANPANGRSARARRRGRRHRHAARRSRV